MGGTNFNKFATIPENARATPTRLAGLAIARLLRNPKELNLIRLLDVLLIHEFGQVSAQLISTLGIVFRRFRFRDSAAFFGGILAFASMDACQLPPVQEKPPLLSPHMLTCFTFCPRDHSVQAANDANSRQIVTIS